MGITIKNATLIELYYFSKIDKEWCFDMSCPVKNGMIHYSIINEIQRCNDHSLKTKIIYS